MTPPDHAMPPKQPIALLRGLLGQCPNCGRARLYKSYLKQVDSCPACGERYGDIQADDGPGWFVMILVGAIVAPTAIFLSLHEILPDWAVFALLAVLAVGGTLLLLPVAKGIFIAQMWRLRKIKVLQGDD